MKNMLVAETFFFNFFFVFVKLISTRLATSASAKAVAALNTERDPAAR